MKINDYGLNAYKKNSSKETSNKVEKDLTVKKAVKNLNSEKSVKTVARIPFCAIMVLMTHSQKY